MKIKFIILFCCLSTTSVFSQKNWASSGATWYYYYGNVITVSGYQEIKYEKDTTINSLVCKALIKKTYLFDYMSQKSDTLPTTYEYTYSDKDKAYIWKYNTFYTLYDFSALPGDSWLVPGVDTPMVCDSVGEVVIDQKGTTLINGQVLRWFTTTAKSGSKYNFRGKVIEQIGGSFCFFPQLSGSMSDNPCLLLDQRSFNFRCFSSDTLGLYINPANNTQACDYLPTDIQQFDNQRNEVSLYPNPATDNIYLKLGDNSISSIKEITIFNIYGSLIKKVSTIESLLTIDLEGYSNGIYFVSVVEHNKKYNFKFIKS